MEKMQSALLLGAGVGLVAYIILIVGIWKGKYQQNFFTFLSWFLISLIVTIYTIKLGSGMTPGVITCIVMTIGLFATTVVIGERQGVVFSTSAQQQMFALALAMLAWWKFRHDGVANYGSISALLIAGAPQVWDILKSPNRKLILPYSLFCITSILFFFGGSWSAKQIFYLVADFATPLTIVVLLVVSRIKTPLLKTA